MRLRRAVIFRRDQRPRATGDASNIYIYIYVTGENTIGGGHYSFFIFVFATGHHIRPTNLIFDRYAHCGLDRAHKKICLQIFIFDTSRAIFFTCLAPNSDYIEKHSSKIVKNQNLQPIFFCALSKPQ